MSLLNLQKTLQSLTTTTAILSYIFNFRIQTCPNKLVLFKITQTSQTHANLRKFMIVKQKLNAEKSYFNCEDINLLSNKYKIGEIMKSLKGLRSKT